MFTFSVSAADKIASVTLEVKQVFNNTSGNDSIDSTFKYELIPDKTGDPLPEGSENDVFYFSISGTNNYIIDNFYFSAAGVYEYIQRLSPTMPQREGYAYDTQEYKISIAIFEQTAGFISWVIVENESGLKVEEILFTQSYNLLPSNPDLMVDPPVKKTVMGNPPKDSKFVFKLTAKDPSYPMPEGSVNGVKTLEIVGSGEAEFGTWSYITPGIYYYTITEEDTKENYTYDTEVYTITDVVTAVDNVLTVHRTVTNSLNKPVDSCTFINKYKGGGPQTGDTLSEWQYVVVLFISIAIALVCVWWLISIAKRKKHR